MLPTISSYIESVSNPTGHFTSLLEMFPRRDPTGRPLLSVRSFTVDFQVCWRGAQYLLKCFLDEHARERARVICAAAADLQSPFMTRCEYLPGEIAVTDSRGHSSLHDVVLQRLPEGSTLHDFLLGCCDNGDSVSLRRFAKRTALLAGWMHREGIAHRNLKPSVIRVDSGCIPVPIHYDFATTDADPADMWADQWALLRIALTACLLAAAPGLYRTMGQERIFYRAELQSIYKAMAETNGLPEVLTKAFEVLFDCRPPESGMLEQLVAVDFALPDDFARRAALLLAAVGYPVTGEDEWPVPLVKEVERIYRATGFAGRQVELDNGHAVMERDGAWGLIDGQGNFVIPPIYEEVEWDGESGLAAVCQDGQWGLCDGGGRQLTGLCHDWLGSMREGLLLARRGDKLGFLNRRGEVAIEFIYDSASSFGGGVAPVSIDGCEFHIDSGGRRVG
jgi:hypothetical protein